MTQATVLDRAKAPAPHPEGDEREEFGRAALCSISAGAGTALTLETATASEAMEIAARLRVWLMTARMSTGGDSVTVSPGFLQDTYPAMRSFTRALDAAGLDGMWHAEDERTIRLGRARHVFVSVDRPLPPASDRQAVLPDTLLEVCDADRIDPAWYRSRVVPRAGAPGLTKVFFGRPAAAPGSLFEQERRVARMAEWRDGRRRTFSLCRAADDLNRAPEPALSA